MTEKTELTEQKEELKKLLEKPIKGFRANGGFIEKPDKVQKKVKRKPTKVHKEVKREPTKVRKEDRIEPTTVQEKEVLKEVPAKDQSKDKRPM